ncbi:MAG: KamA family radical SAM protein [Syntrophales bacterium]|jgi:lysine 2,3-aminomutase|nr:KamA family radical SAM protein [Syntrophales bacterium]MDY0045234.1 KamA family radical SAM protein [Syntrophales bacterium]
MGLENDIIEARICNRRRILDYFKATDENWRDWKWHVRHIVRDADTLKNLIELSDSEEEAVRRARLHGIPFGITPYYVSLMDNRSDSVGRDRAVRAQVIPSPFYIESVIAARKSGISMDFMRENDTSPIEGITRRYPMIVILKPIMTCPQICVYCQRNWEIEDACMPDATVSKTALDRAVRWIEKTESIREVLVTGGDPFLLSDKRLENILFELSRIEHIERIRIGTRMPITLPQRVTDDLVSAIDQFHTPGVREVLIVTHCEHPFEITPEMMEAVQKFKLKGISVYNQLVYTYYNSRKYEAAFLRNKLRMIGVTPYYTFNTKGKEETEDYRVPLARILQEQKEEARLFPGSVRTDEVVFNVPGLGKNYLKGAQHRDMISILPDGRRVYEFHPWEKNMKLADTYVHIDVSIHDYLEKLKAEGEDMELYQTIWYYY